MRTTKRSNNFYNASQPGCGGSNSTTRGLTSISTIPPITKKRYGWLSGISPATRDFILRQAAFFAFAPRQSGWLKDEPLHASGGFANYREVVESGGTND